MLNIDDVTEIEADSLAMPLQITASQQEMLERLHNHTAFSEQIILLCGPQGAGKSSILEVFLEQASDYANLAYLPSPGNLQPTSIRKRLLKQLVQLDAYATQDTLEEALQRNLKSGTQHIVIVVDDASGLPPAILTEFQSLLANSELNTRQTRFSVILAGSLDWAARAKKGLSLGAAEPPVVLKVEPFNSTEKAWFARSLLDTQPVQVSDHRLRELLPGMGGYPGDIQKKLQDLVMPPKPKPQQSPGQENDNSKRNSSWLSAAHNKVLVIVAVAALLSLAFTLFLHRETLQDKLSAEPSGEQESAIEQTPPGQGPDTVVETAAEETEPEATSPTTLDYGDMLSRLRQSSQENRSERDLRFQLVQPLQALQDAEVEVEEAPEAPAEDTTAPIAEVDAAENDWLNSYDNQALWKAEADSYVLQIGAFSEENRLQSFLSEFENELDTMIYHTERNDSDWYVITLGRFASAEEARAYLEQDDALGELQPWPKSVAAIHNELAVVLE
ncbi:hypothetical protein CWE09_11990 [Aliidiomarina minuta]|uniref:SPOR domain-containing protein n=1 Tax=Aliidiomarina minuta TaxID=880057 RepID=A0A432W3F1_9GAMM|nr:AAA family ATPase [Aliidiomarina minuta]RUO23867.1 hypothetical protein CWE09_11990 [Aliidiomarina minuta]